MKPTRRQPRSKDDNNKWLELLYKREEPFLTESVVEQQFATGPDPVKHISRQILRQRYDQWLTSNRREEATSQWVEFVLTNVLQFKHPTSLRRRDELPASVQALPRKRSRSLPDFAVVNRPKDVAAGEPRMLVQIWPGQNLEAEIRLDGSDASPLTRMADLLRQVRHQAGPGQPALPLLGLVTNGEDWLLVHTTHDTLAGYAFWRAIDWFDFPDTLRGFYTLLSNTRFFKRPDATLEQLLIASLRDEQDVTDRLGAQVRAAVEMLVYAIARCDRYRPVPLLDGIDSTTLYEATLSFMMRLVILFYAEDKRLLPIDNPNRLYADYYAATTLREQLQAVADRRGEAALQGRFTAWSRLLATFRLVFAGCDLPELSVPAYGGSLFDPDRYPFLEGRPAGSKWLTQQAEPLPIDDLTVFYLLESLQTLERRGTGGRRNLRFTALSVSQIGHVYEGLLDHTAYRADATMIVLSGKPLRDEDTDPELLLTDLEAKATDSPAALLAYLRLQTGRDEAWLRKSLGWPSSGDPDPASRLSLSVPDEERLRRACGDDALFERLRPYALLLKQDRLREYMVIPTGSFYVSSSDSRRATGTHYTPRTLVEPIVEHALTPLVYRGPAEGWPRDDWQLRPTADLLNLRVCDMAMGSGAFLVEACDFLAQHLLKAWQRDEDDYRAIGKRDPRIDAHGKLLTVGRNALALPPKANDRLLFARRLVVERCIYGVDKNRLAVEMAKLSLWIFTMQPDKPFDFLDHTLREGDSLLGLASLDQLRSFNLAAKTPPEDSLFSHPLDLAVVEATRLRLLIAAQPVASQRDNEEKAKLLGKAEAATAAVRCAADLLTATAFLPAKERKATASRWLDGWERAYNSSDKAALAALAKEARTVLGDHRPFHWPLEFPEAVAARDSGFSAFIGNPPFMGGKMISGPQGSSYREYLVDYLANKQRGHADLVVYFFLRANTITQAGSTLGFIGTDKIAKGDSHEIGLSQLVDRGWRVTRALPSTQWPGSTANVSIAQFWMYKGKWSGLYSLNYEEVDRISSALTAESQESTEVQQLKANMEKSFNGVYVMGMGFVLNKAQVDSLINQDARNQEVISPYLTGEDLNKTPNQSYTRWVINFGRMSLEEASSYPACMSIVLDRVRDERLKQNDKQGREKWWQFLRTRAEMYEAIAGMKRVLVQSIVSTYLSLAFCPPDWTFAHKCVVFPLDGYSHFSLLQSTIHDAWVRRRSDNRGSGISYSPTDCFETFPFPTDLSGLAGIGERYYLHRQQIMQGAISPQQQPMGLTDTYNRLHNEADQHPDIAELRRLHAELDAAVAVAYGWADLSLDHDFYGEGKERRYTISPAARREVLNLLLRLNHERYAAEVAAGLHPDKQAKASKRKAKPDQETLALEVE